MGVLWDDNDDCALADILSILTFKFPDSCCYTLQNSVQRHWRMKKGLNE